MSFISVKTAFILGLKAHLIEVECDIGRGTNFFSLIGLTDKAIDESGDRISAALRNAGYTNPKQMNQRTVISLAPANLRKEGTLFDLPIAMAYLAASEQIIFAKNVENILENSLFVGELSLQGELRELRGALAITELAKKNKIKNIFLPQANVEEAALIPGINIFGAKNLKEIIQHLEGKKKIFAAEPTNLEFFKDKFLQNNNFRKNPVDMSDIKGQTAAKRALLIAAAGGHNIALYGPPGTGKTMLARAARDLLPELNQQEILEVTRIHSIAGTASLEDSNLILEAPFRSPHHTSSYVSLVGGGATPRPGEVTLAHGGILFLDEFPEFEKKSIEALREPLEEGFISISRAKGTEKFPAKFMLIAAMNPCPCGNRGNKDKKCICTMNDIARYERKLSGPIIDRVDIWIQVSNIPYAQLGTAEKSGDSSEEFKKKILIARTMMKKRFASYNDSENLAYSKIYLTLNRDMSAKEITIFANLSPEIKSELDIFAQKLNLSPRAYHRVLRVARTIADCDEKENISKEHILEALQYRPKI